MLPAKKKVICDLEQREYSSVNLSEDSGVVWFEGLNFSLCHIKEKISI